MTGATLVVLHTFLIFLHIPLWEIAIALPAVDAPQSSPVSFVEKLFDVAIITNCTGSVIRNALQVFNNLQLDLAHGC